MHFPRWPAWSIRRAAWHAAVAVFACGSLAIGGEAVFRARLDGNATAGPARFYARPVVLRPGLRVDAEVLNRYAARMGYRRTSRAPSSPGQFRAGTWEWSIYRRPLRVAGSGYAGGIVTARLDYDGTVLALEDSAGAWLDSAILEPEPLRTPGLPGEDRVPVRLADVPANLVDAVLTIEDRRFFQHSGVDVARIAGAALANLRARTIEQGGSTITQQLAKNLFLSARRTPLRKARELAMALVLEARYSKSQILERYLNEVYLGHSDGYAIRGVGRAAQVYFGKDVSSLTAAESAMLAGLIHGPNLYAPFDRPKSTIARRNLVLELMRDRGLLDSAATRRLAKSPLGVRRGPAPNRAGRYFADLAARELGDHFAGPAVMTTLDMGRQIVAETAVRDGLQQIERDRPSLRRKGNALQAALVALDPATGEILALVGGRDYGTTQFNRAVDARRQPGSAFKPIVALTALSSREVTLASRLDDEPLRVETQVGLWEPANYDGQFRGPVTLRRALEQSLNVPFARLGLAMGPDRIAATAHQLGIRSPLREVPSLALGSSEVTPLELAGAYAVLATEGFRATPHALRMDSRGPNDGGLVFEPGETFLVTSALEGAVDRGTGRGLRAWGYDGAIAAKSGTSNDYRDAWFVGYTPTLVVAVWVGFDDGRTLGLSGAQAALPIFARFMLAEPAGDYASFVPPPGVESRSIDPQTGIARASLCGGETEYFLVGTGPESGDSCWPDVPKWLSEAGSEVVGGIRGFIGRVFRRHRH